MKDTKEMAKERIIEAVKHLEGAEKMLLHTCILLSPVDGLLADWEDAGQLHTAVKALRQSVSYKVDGGFDLDSDNRHALEQRNRKKEDL